MTGYLSDPMTHDNRFRCDDCGDTIRTDSLDLRGETCLVCGGRFDPA